MNVCFCNGHSEVQLATCRSTSVTFLILTQSFHILLQATACNRQTKHLKEHLLLFQKIEDKNKIHPCLKHSLLPCLKRTEKAIIFHFLSFSRNLHDLAAELGCSGSTLNKNITIRPCSHHNRNLKIQRGKSTENNRTDIGGFM